MRGMSNWQYQKAVTVSAKRQRRLYGAPGYHLWKLAAVSVLRLATSRDGDYRSSVINPLFSLASHKLSVTNVNSLTFRHSDFYDYNRVWRQYGVLPAVSRTPVYVHARCGEQRNDLEKKHELRNVSTRKQLRHKLTSIATAREWWAAPSERGPTRF
jgi:hypothetical protein